MEDLKPYKVNARGKISESGKATYASPQCQCGICDCACSCGFCIAKPDDVSKESELLKKLSV